jgi:hypothetical protein
MFRLNLFIKVNNYQLIMEINIGGEEKDIFKNWSIALT